MSVPLLKVVGILMFTASSLLAQSWTLTTATNPVNWTSVAMSADGRRWIASAANNDYHVYLSTNSGVSWKPADLPTNQWVTVASSADGSKLVAAAATISGKGPIYVSTNYGLTWNLGITDVWASVAVSADGSKLAAAVGPTSGTSYVRVSTDSGATWGISNHTAKGWNTVAISADGSIIAATGGITLQISTNSGSTWITNINLHLNYGAQGVAMSADGGTIMLGADGFRTTTDFGLTWKTNLTTFIQHSACSADASHVVATPPFASAAFQSTDSGMDWASNYVAAGILQCAAISADGNLLALGFSNGGIWKWQAVPAPVLKITISDNVTVSWIVPSADFILQENTDITTTNWTTATNPPVFNYTNLNYEVTLATPVSARFFRLISSE